MFGRKVEPTAQDILNALPWHDPLPLDISRFGRATQARIIERQRTGILPHSTPLAPRPMHAHRAR